MPFFDPAKTIIDCVSLQVSQSAFKMFDRLRRKRVYLFTSKATISIEAAISISIFIMVILFMESYMLILNTEFSIQTKINNVVTSFAKDMFWIDSIDEAIGKSKQANQVKEEILEIVDLEDLELIKKNMEKSYLYGRLIQEIEIKNTKFFLCGVAGINTTESSVENNIVDLVATYKMELPFVNKYITLTQRGKVRAWTGVDISKQKDMVYITKTGHVYHITKDCPSLSIRIRKVSYRAAKTGYGKCDICIGDTPDLDEGVFVTEDGDKYHISLKCRGLVRNIISVSKDEVTDMDACSKCN